MRADIKATFGRRAGRDSRALLECHSTSSQPSGAVKNISIRLSSIVLVSSELGGLYGALLV